jgi:hypothetical protein
VASCEARRDPIGALKLLTGPSNVALLARDEPHRLLDACELGPLGLSPEEHPILTMFAHFDRAHASLYLGHGADIARPDRLAQTLAPLPLRTRP